MYPGTFDPFTNGHEEIVRRAATLFSRVIVAIAEGSGKEPMFSLEERIVMAREVLSGLDNVEVEGYDGLTVKFARAKGLQAIVRGLRAVSDFEYEFQLATMNRHLEPDVETVFLTPTEKYTFVSSTLVREIAAMGGDVSTFVHSSVNKALRKRCST
jgi:pantetheine-phosphate adenylyltransferase